MSAWNLNFRLIDIILIHFRFNLSIFQQLQSLFQAFYSLLQPFISCFRRHFVVVTSIIDARRVFLDSDLRPEASCVAIALWCKQAAHSL